MSFYRTATLVALTAATMLTFAFPVAGMAPSGLENSDFRFFTNPPPASNFKMCSADGSAVNLSDLKGRVVLLNFWRKDCQYCDLEKGQLKSMLQHVKSDDIAVLCVNLWDSPTWVRQYAKKNGRDLEVLSKLEGQQPLVENVVGGRPMGYYILNDAKEAIYEVRGFPSTYVIDKNGRVLASHLGLAQWNAPPIRDWIIALARAGVPGEKADVKSSNREVDVPAWIDRLLTNSNAAPRRLGDTLR